MLNILASDYGEVTKRTSWLRMQHVALFSYVVVFLGSWLVLRGVDVPKINDVLIPAFVLMLLPQLLAPLLFSTLCYQLNKRVQSWVDSVDKFRSADELLRSHTELRKLIEGVHSTWHTWVCVQCIHWMAGSIIALFSEYARAFHFEGMHGPLAATSIAQVVFMLVLLVWTANLLLGIARINDKHQLLKKTLIEGAVFPLSDRSAVLHQLDLLPITFTVLGQPVSISLITRLFAAVLGGALPVVAKSLLNV